MGHTSVGATDGEAVGNAVFAALGVCVGTATSGFGFTQSTSDVRLPVGASVPCTAGALVGHASVGTTDGDAVGDAVIAALGLCVGTATPGACGSCGFTQSTSFNVCLHRANHPPTEPATPFSFPSAAQKPVTPISVWIVETF